MGDSLRDLPTDSLPPTVDEKEMIQWMFTGVNGKDKSLTTTSDVGQDRVQETATVMTPRFHVELKTLIVVMLLYMAVSSSWTDSVIQKMLPVTSASPIFLTVSKSILFAIILLLFFNFSYSR
jgi:hypothetical protein